LRLEMSSPIPSTSSSRPPTTERRRLVAHRPAVEFDTNRRIDDRIAVATVHDQARSSTIVSAPGYLSNASAYKPSAIESGDRF
jgi:hypothetical protein